MLKIGRLGLSHTVMSLYVSEKGGDLHENPKKLKKYSCSFIDEDIVPYWTRALLTQNVPFTRAKMDRI